MPVHGEKITVYLHIIRFSMLPPFLWASFIQAAMLLIFFCSLQLMMPLTLLLLLFLDCFVFCVYEHAITFYSRQNEANLHNLLYTFQEHTTVQSFREMIRSMALTRHFYLAYNFLVFFLDIFFNLMFNNWIGLDLTKSSVFLLHSGNFVFMFGYQLLWRLCEIHLIFLFE